MIRVLHLLTRANIGGPARHVFDVAGVLGPGFSVTVAAGAAPEEEGTLPAPPGVRTLPVGLTRPISPRRDWAAWSAIRRVLDEERPTVLHTHMAKAGALGRSAARRAQRPPLTVHTYHGHVLAGYFPRHLERAFVRVERRLARQTDALVAVSPEIRDELLDLGIGSAAQYLVVPPGRDLSSFLAVEGPSGSLRAALHLHASTPLLVVAGRLAPIKGHRHLLTALADLPDVHLAVLGDGELRAELESVARELDLGARVHFMGWWGDMAGAFADADVVVQTSLNEGTPLALVEAAAAARPVVATDVGGTRAVVRDGRTGVLVPAGDSAALGAALRRLLGDPEGAAGLGAAGRRHVRHSFAAEASARALGSLYSDLASRRPAA